MSPILNDDDDPTRILVRGHAFADLTATSEAATCRILVTARCCRKGHTLAELAVTEDGVRFVRVRHHRAVTDVNDPGYIPRAGVYDYLVTDARFVTMRCSCGPYRVSIAGLEAAAADGVPVILAEPKRDSMP